MIVCGRHSPRSAYRDPKNASPGLESGPCDRNGGCGRSDDYRESAANDGTCASGGSGCCCGSNVAGLELACTRLGLRLNVDMAVAVAAERRELGGVGHFQPDVPAPGGRVASLALVGLMGSGRLQTMVLELEMERCGLPGKVARELVLDRRMIPGRICSRRRLKIPVNETLDRVVGSLEGCIVGPFWLIELFDKLDRGCEGCRVERELHTTVCSMSFTQPCTALFCREIAHVLYVVRRARLQKGTCSATSD